MDGPGGLNRALREARTEIVFSMWGEGVEHVTRLTYLSLMFRPRKAATTAAEFGSLNTITST
jgi:hypothetical protein